jgi:hypothetical protein
MSVIESNRAYVTFDHHLDWDHGGGSNPMHGFGGTTEFHGDSGFISVEDYWFILRRIR